MRTPAEQVMTLTATTDQLQMELESVKRIVTALIIAQIVLTMCLLRKVTSAS